MRVHLHVTFQEDEADILHCGLSEHAFLSFEVELMLVEDVCDGYPTPYNESPFPGALPVTMATTTT